MSQRSDDALVAIRQIQRRIDIDTRKLAQAAGLSPSQMLVIQILDERGETAIGDIVKDTQLSNATITSLVDKMVTRGLVSRRRWDQDRRRVWLTLEPAGRQALKDAPRLLQDTFGLRFDKLDNWEQAMLVATLERVASLLDAERLDAAPILTSGAVAAPPDQA
ncbi:MAG: MarR family winged helix-turn-helix transcriptional regulator [Pseudomonadota bacterium]